VTDLPTTSARAELSLAEETLEAARVLARAGMHRHAVGRAYYAIFHAACALLASIGRTARTHDGVRALINEHFVKPGALDARNARVFRQTAADRNDADYDAAATFDAEDSRQDIEQAEAFVAEAKRLVGGGGKS
jgi:uncharacterized protein (UPF0332 family)